MSVSRGGAGGILIRIETHDGVSRWRNVPDLRHRTLCDVAGLNPDITWFDMPSTFSETGSARAAAGDGVKRQVSGYIHQGPRDQEPIGKLVVVGTGEKIPEYEERQWLRLG
jgi:hypothetical protein